jgi:hypothetical protein
VNEDATEWAAVCLVLLWLWCLVALVPAMLVGRSRRVERVVHASGVVALALFAVFWLSLLGPDSDAAGFVVAPLVVGALVAWALRRYAVTSLACWLAVVVLVVTGSWFMAFYGPAPVAVVSGFIALFSRGREREPVT